MAGRQAEGMQLLSVRSPSSPVPCSPPLRFFPLAYLGPARTQVGESDADLVLEWQTQLSNRSRIRRTEVFAKNGALTAAPRLDGCAGTAAAQARQ